MGDQVRFKWLKRDLGYVFWMFVEQASNLAIPRLILFPLVAYTIGKEEFGLYMTALSITLILGTQPQNGLATGVLRFVSDYSSEQQGKIYVTAIKLLHTALLVVILFGILSIGVIWMGNIAPFKLLICILPLLLSLYPENQIILFLTEARYLRQFKVRTQWLLMRSLCIVLFGYLGAVFWDAIGLAIGTLIGNMIVFLMLVSKRREWLKTVYDKDMAGQLKQVWFQITFAGIIAISGPYLCRIFLSYFDSFSSVGDLSAATSIVLLFLVPVTTSGGLILSMISPYAHIRDLSGSAIKRCLAVLILSLVFLPLAFYWIGPLLCDFLYPKFGQEMIQLTYILIWMIPANCLICLCRPFVIKFGHIVLVPWVNIISALVLLITALILIPSGGASGAAWSLVVGQVTMGGLWFIIFLLLLMNIKKLHH